MRVDALPPALQADSARLYRPGGRSKGRTDAEDGKEKSYQRTMSSAELGTMPGIRYGSRQGSGHGKGCRAQNDNEAGKQSSGRSGARRCRSRPHCHSFHEQPFQAVQRLVSDAGPEVAKPLGRRCYRANQPTCRAARQTRPGFEPADHVERTGRAVGCRTGEDTGRRHGRSGPKARRSLRAPTGSRSRNCRGCRD